MDKDNRVFLKDQIISQIEHLQEQIKKLEEKCKPIAPDCSLGRLTRLEAMGESHVANSILDESRLRLTRLQNTLSRIERDDFGICIECEEPIAFERLKIRPESVRCAACESKKAKLSKKSS